MTTGFRVKNRSVGDVFIYEVAQIYNRTSVTLKNDDLTDDYTITDPCGQPCEADGTLIVAGNEANARALVAYDKNLPDIAANGGESIIPVPIVDAGPVVINESALPANDIEGNALTWATIKANLPNTFKFITESTKRSEQTT